MFAPPFGSGGGPHGINPRGSLTGHYEDGAGNDHGFFATKESTARKPDSGKRVITAQAQAQVHGSFAGWLTTRGPGNNLGVVTGSGTTAGNFSGTVDFINGAGSFPGTTVSGSYGAPAYTSLDSTTGRGTGVVTFTNGNASSSTNVVIYALRRISFLVLDVQSSNLDVGWAP